ncbi:GTP cyclohydrolase 1 [Burkholderia phage vB_BglM_WTB]
MLRAIVYERIVGTNETKVLFQALGSNTHMLMKSLSISFQAECKKAGLRADVHAENVLEMLVEEYGLLVKIGDDSDLI